MTDMSIPISYLTSDRSTQNGSTSDPGTLDPQAFLMLLVTQLQNQDPSSPTDTATILTQTSQLAQMEAASAETTAAQQSFALQLRIAAASYVGQQVSWKDSDGNTQTGVVSSVSFDSAMPNLVVGDADVPIDSILTLAPPASGTSSTSDGSGSSDSSDPSAA